MKTLIGLIVKPLSWVHKWQDNKIGGCSVPVLYFRVTWSWLPGQGESKSGSISLPTKTYAKWGTFRETAQRASSLQTLTRTHNLWLYWVCLLLMSIKKYTVRCQHKLLFIPVNVQLGATHQLINYLFCGKLPRQTTALEGSTENCVKLLRYYLLWSNLSK